jgi:hypothetical protein
MLAHNVGMATECPAIVRLLYKVDEGKADAHPSRATEAFASNDALSAPIPRGLFCSRWFCSRRGGLRLRVNAYSHTSRRQADFFCGRLNGITSPYCSGRIHFAAFFLKLLGTKNSIIVAIKSPRTCKNKTEATKFSFLTNLYICQFLQWKRRNQGLCARISSCLRTAAANICCAQRPRVGHHKDVLQPLYCSNGLLSAHPSQYLT